MLNIGNSTNLKLSDNNTLLISKIDRSSANNSIEIKLKFVNHLSTINVSELLKFDETPSDTQLIVNFLKEMYLNKLVILKQLIFVNYIGQKLVFQIEEIDSNRFESKPKKDCQLSNDFSNKLNIQESQQSNFNEQVFITDDIKAAACDKSKFKFSYF